MEIWAMRLPRPFHLGSSSVLLCWPVRQGPPGAGGHLLLLSLSLFSYYYFQSWLSRRNKVDLSSPFVSVRFTGILCDHPRHPSPELSHLPRRKECSWHTSPLSLPSF